MNESEAEQNWDSPPGSGIGCCVIASSKIAANYLGLRAVGEEMKRLTYTDRGGHFPEKVDRQWASLKTKFPGFTYHQWWDGDESKLFDWINAGRPVGITYAWGKRYNNGRQKIGHMVLLIGLEEDRQNGFAVILDNNFPQERSQIPIPELLNRWKANSGGWGLVITSGKPSRPAKPDPIPKPGPDPGPEPTPKPTSQDSDQIAIAIALGGLGMLLVAIGAGLSKRSA